MVHVYKEEPEDCMVRSHNWDSREKEKKKCWNSAHQEKRRWWDAGEVHEDIIKAGNKQSKDVNVKTHHAYIIIKLNQSSSCMRNQPDTSLNYLKCLKCILNATKQERPSIWLYWLQFIVCDAHPATAVSIWLDPASAVVWQRLPRFTAAQTSGGKTNRHTFRASPRLAFLPLQAFMESLPKTHL